MLDMMIPALIAYDDKLAVMHTRTALGFLLMLAGVVFAGYTLFVHAWLPLLGTSYTRDPLNPGHRSSDTYSADWFLFQFAATRWLIIFVGMLLVAFTQFRGLLYALWACLGVGILYEAIVIVRMGVIWGTICNMPGVKWNICNDYRYCCRYYSTPDTSCYNTTGCASGEIVANADWISNFTMSCFFLFWWILTAGISYLVARDLPSLGRYTWVALPNGFNANWWSRDPRKVINQQREDTYRYIDAARYIHGILLLTASVVFLFFFFFVLGNTPQQGQTNVEYPLKQRPGASGRFSLAWAATHMSAIRVFPVLFGLAAITFFQWQILHWLYYLSVALAFAYELAFLLGALVIWIGSCNRAGSGWTMCNDYRYCCVHYGGGSQDDCPNTVACSFALSADELSPNADFIALFVFCCFYLALWTLLLVALVYLEDVMANFEGYRQLINETTERVMYFGSGSYQDAQDYTLQLLGGGGGGNDDDDTSNRTTDGRLIRQVDPGTDGDNDDDDGTLEVVPKAGFGAMVKLPLSQTEEVLPHQFGAFPARK